MIFHGHFRCGTLGQFDASIGAEILFLAEPKSNGERFRMRGTRFVFQLIIEKNLREREESSRSNIDDRSTHFGSSSELVQKFDRRWRIDGISYSFCCHCSKWIMYKRSTERCASLVSSRFTFISSSKRQLENESVRVIRVFVLSIISKYFAFVASRVISHSAITTTNRNGWIAH